jgi:hypothetical protein
MPVLSPPYPRPRWKKSRSHTRTHDIWSPISNYSFHQHAKLLSPLPGSTGSVGKYWRPGESDVMGWDGLQLVSIHGDLHHIVALDMSSWSRHGPWTNIQYDDGLGGISCCIIPWVASAVRRSSSWSSSESKGLGQFFFSRSLPSLIHSCSSLRHSPFFFHELRYSVSPMVLRHSWFVWEVSM